MITMAKWTREQTIMLLELYKQYPHLYDNRNLCYSDRSERHKTLHIIAKELEKIRPKTSIRDLKQKIRTIRTQYSVEKHKYHKSQSKECYSPRLWCYDFLKFLDGVRTYETKQPTASQLEALSIPLGGENDGWKSRQSTTDVAEVQNVEISEDTSRNSEAISCDVSAPISPTVHLGEKPEGPNTNDKRSRNYAFAKFIRGELDSILDKEILEDVKWDIQMAIRNGLKLDRNKKHTEGGTSFQCLESRLILSPSPSQSSSSAYFHSSNGVKQELSEDEA